MSASLERTPGVQVSRHAGRDREREDPRLKAALEKEQGPQLRPLLGEAEEESAAGLNPACTSNSWLFRLRGHAHVVD
jgi:hypothetical protein